MREVWRTRKGCCDNVELAHGALSRLRAANPTSCSLQPCQELVSAARGCLIAAAAAECGRGRHCGATLRAGWPFADTALTFLLAAISAPPTLAPDFLAFPLCFVMMKAEWAV